MIWCNDEPCEWTHMGNVLDTPVTVEGESWGTVKGNFR